VELMMITFQEKEEAVEVAVVVTAVAEVSVEAEVVKPVEEVAKLVEEVQPDLVNN
jgi:hypothetical protein